MSRDLFHYSMLLQVPSNLAIKPFLCSLTTWQRYSIPQTPLGWIQFGFQALGNVCWVLWESAVSAPQVRPWFLLSQVVHLAWENKFKSYILPHCGPQFGQKPLYHCSFLITDLQLTRFRIQNLWWFTLMNEKLNIIFERK